MNEVLVELFRHKGWSTLLLIEACQGLDEKALDASTPGTYGSIRDTLRHLVGADESYLATVTGELHSEPLPEGPASLEELANLTRQLTARWEAVAIDADLQRGAITTKDGWRTPAAIPIAQAIQHAECHRGHVASILGATALRFQASTLERISTSGITAPPPE